MAPKIRIESLTDLVFGLALSIGALVLTLQEHSSQLDFLVSIFWFVFSFLILTSVWLNYSYIIAQIPVERPREVALNLLLLLCVSIEPFLLNVMVDNSNHNDILSIASAAYAIDISVIMAALGVFLHVAMRDNERRGEHEKAKGNLDIRNSRAFYAGLFLLTALPFFWEARVNGVPLRFIMWFASPVIWVTSIAVGWLKGRRAR